MDNVVQRADFGIIDCPVCIDGTIYWPVISWGDGVHGEYGDIEYEPLYDNPFCSKGCYLTPEDIEEAYPPIEYITVDIDEDGKPLDNDEEVW